MLANISMRNRWSNYPACNIERNLLHKFLNKCNRKERNYFARSNFSPLHSLLGLKWNILNNKLKWYEILNNSMTYVHDSNVIVSKAYWSISSSLNYMKQISKDTFSCWPSQVLLKLKKGAIYLFISFINKFRFYIHNILINIKSKSLIILIFISKII